MPIDLDQYNKDTLANLIFRELARVQALARQANTENTARYWREELADMERLYGAVWDQLLF